MILFLIILGTISYAGIILAFTRGPLYVNSNLFGAFVNFIGALIPIGLFVLYRGSEKVTRISNKGVFWSILGGLSVALFTIAFAKIFSTGQNVSFVTPLVYGGAVILSSVAGIIFFKETQSNAGIIGILLIAIGIGFISLSAYQKGLIK